MYTPVKPPIITDPLIQYLESFYKDRVPELKDDDRTIWFNAGAVSVVRHLKRLKAQQENNILNKE